MGLIHRIVGVLLGILFLAAVLVFASLALGIILAVGLLVWGWVWWRSRSQFPPVKRGAVVEGEYRHVTPRQSIDRNQKQ